MRTFPRPSMLRFSPRWTLPLSLLLLGVASASAQDAEPADVPARILITNDNGLDDEKIVALARAFARHSEVWVVAPDRDRSGAGTFLSVTRGASLTVDPRDIGPGIRAFAVDGFPADCVFLALSALMADNPPDLIVSGINGGDNAGTDWLNSGTVGAARIGAIAGVPSIAVSGLDDDIPGAVEAAVDWVVRLAGTGLVRGLGPLGYLTVSLPRTAPDEILGVRVTDRAPLMVVPRLGPVSETTWAIVGADTISTVAPRGSDRAALAEGYIAVVPMRVDEVDLDLLARWRRNAPGLPDWR